MKFINFTSLIALLFTLACSRDYLPQLDRSEIQSLPEGFIEKPAWSIIDSPIYNGGIQACDLIDELSLKNNSGPKDYRFFARLRQDSETQSLVGAIDISKNSFLSLVLAENVQIPSKLQFYNQAKAEYRAGRLSRVKWYALNAAYKSGIGFESLMYSKINDQILTGFPGLFGKLSPISDSLFGSILQRSSNIDFIHATVEDLPRQLLRSFPSFAGNTWKQSASQNHQISSSVLAAFYTDQDATQKACAVSLGYNLFSQLLAIKGHKAPTFKISSHKLSYIEKLSASRTKISTYKNFGFFRDSSGKPLILTPELIASYDPATYFVKLQSLNNGNTKISLNSPANFQDEISFLSSMAMIYQLSSPAITRINNESGYLFGDINNSPTAIFPPEMHSLATGFSIMGLKNLAAQYIIQVNSDDQIKQRDQAAAGAIIGERINASTVELNLKSLVNLSTSLVQWDLALTEFHTKPPSYWKFLNKQYDKKMLASLLGAYYFSTSELREIFPDGFPAGSSLQAQIKALYLPLAQLLVRLDRGLGECTSKALWNFKEGTVRPVNYCTDEDRTKLAEALNRISTHTSSPVLWRKPGSR